MSETISGLVANYGYVLVFFLVGLESLGIPLPGETALVSAAAYAALGHLSIALVIVAAAAGAIVGDNAGYWIGRKGGRAFVLHYGRRLRLNEEQHSSDCWATSSDAACRDSNATSVKQAWHSLFLRPCLSHCSSPGTGLERMKI